MKPRITAVWLLACVLFPLSIHAGERPIVAVFDMEDRTSTFNREILDNLTEFLSVKLAEGGYQVIPRDQVRVRLVAEKRDTYRECVDKSCQIELGRELAAQKVLSAKILKVAGRCQLAATLFDLKKAATENAATAEGSCDEESMGRAVLKVSTELIETPKVAERPPRSLVVVEEKELEEASPFSTWGHITFWSGVGAAAFGTVSGILASSAGNDYKAGDRGAYDRSVTLTGCMYTGLAAGGALIITGIVLWALDTDEDPPSGVTSFSALPSPEGGLVLTLGGRF
jgi:hypothetical protein